MWLIKSSSCHRGEGGRATGNYNVGGKGEEKAIMKVVGLQRQRGCSALAALLAESAEVSSITAIPANSASVLGSSNRALESTTHAPSVLNSAKLMQRRR